MDRQEIMYASTGNDAAKYETEKSQWLVRQTSWLIRQLTDEPVETEVFWKDDLQSYNLSQFFFLF